jgi:2-oxoglutarate ferredoxin oxidoreductase subunit alpha
MQSRWGTHGDHPTIVVAPNSVQEIYEQTIRAFNLAEEYRTPVIVLYDEVIAHLIESVALPAKASIVTVDRKWAAKSEPGYLPYAETEDLIPVMSRPGDGHRVHVTGLTHTEEGFPSQKPEIAERVTRRLIDKIELHRDRIESFEAQETADAEVLIVAIGIVARAARRAVVDLRAQGIKAGLLRPITLWPFPERAVREAAARARHVLVPEMNAGQLALEVERLTPTKVSRLNRLDGEPISPAEIIHAAKELRP